MGLPSAFFFLEKGVVIYTIRHRAYQWAAQGLARSRPALGEKGGAAPFARASPGMQEISNPARWVAGWRANTQHVMTQVATGRKLTLRATTRSTTFSHEPAAVTAYIDLGSIPSNKLPQVSIHLRK
jgi:hypothetical protein